MRILYHTLKERFSLVDLEIPNNFPSLKGKSMLAILFALNFFVLNDFNVIDLYKAPVEKLEELEYSKFGRVSAYWWGYSAEDATESIQSAIESGTEEVVIPNVGSPWVVRPIKLRSGLRLLIMPGVVIEAKKGEFKGRNDSLISAVDAENIEILGYGAVLRMHKRDYQDKMLYEPAEWRMVISLRGCKNVKIEGVRCESSGGDGIYIGSTENRNYCEDVVIRNVVCYNNHRQGISVISAKNLVIENCRLADTWGTPPQAGIDFEPNNASEFLTEIVMRNCLIFSNRGPGILIYLKKLNSASSPVNLKVERCWIKGGKDFGLAIGEVPDKGVRSKILVEDTVIENAEKGGVFIFNKSSEGVPIELVNCAIINSPQNKKGASVKIYQFREEGIKSLGGIHFENLFVRCNFEVRAMELKGIANKTIVKDIAGKVSLGGKLLSGCNIEKGVTVADFDVEFDRVDY